MSEELVKINSGALALPDATAAFEVDFGQIKKITPYTLNIDQPMTEKDGVQPGMLRVIETGKLRKTMKVVLIEKPRESRKMQLGKYPNQKLVCFSRDMKAPDREAPDPQAMACAGCKHASWERYNKSKNNDDAPACIITERVVMIDFEDRYPLQMYVRGKSRTGGLQDGLQQVIQQFLSLKMSKGSVAWTDVALTLTTEKYKGNPNYGLKIKDVHPLTDEERTHLADIVNLIGQQKAQFLQRCAEAEKTMQTVVDDAPKAETKPADTSNPIDAEYVGGVEEV